MKLATLYEDYNPIHKIKTCDCADQTCSGKFLQIYHWQSYCQWESLKRGLATHMDLKHNIFKNMKLILTIQELKDEKTKETYKGMFGTLTLQRHKDLFEEEMLDYAEKHKTYLAEVEKNEENGLIEPVKPVLKAINFAINTKSIEGLDDILNNLVTDATNLERQEQFKKMRAKTAEKNAGKAK